MSAKFLAAGCFEPTAEQKVGADPQALAGHAAACRFREALWHEYRFEAINAGCNPAQAAEYANALSQEMGQAADVPELTPAGRGWSYQSGVRVVRRTLSFGLIRLAPSDKIKAIRRMAVPVFSFGFRPWNLGGKS